MIIGECTEYVYKLNADEYEQLRDWVRDPCYDCPIDDDRIGEKLYNVVADSDSPTFFAMLADIVDKVEELEVKVKRLNQRLAKMTTEMSRREVMPMK